MRRAVPAVILVSIALAGDGFRPWPKPGDYPAHEDLPSATIAAAVLSADQIKKVFGGDVGRRYVVVEVAIYPQTRFEVHADDFRLKGPDGDLARTESPRRVAQAWNEKTPTGTATPRNGPAVIQETGVEYGTWRDPVTGQRQKETGVYSSTTVTNDPRAQPLPQPPPGPDPAVGARLDALALPEGRTVDEVAGYLYFPKPSKKAKQFGLLWSNGSSSVTLSLPVK